MSRRVQREREREREYISFKLEEGRSRPVSGEQRGGEIKRRRRLSQTVLSRVSSNRSQGASGQNALLPYTQLAQHRREKDARPVEEERTARWPNTAPLHHKRHRSTPDQKWNKPRFFFFSFSPPDPWLSDAPLAYDGIGDGLVSLPCCCLCPCPVPCPCPCFGAA